MYFFLQKEEAPLIEQQKPKTLSEAGIIKEIDIYKPGTYWVYYWAEFGYNGDILNVGFDTIKVMNSDTNLNSRTLFGSVNGQLYSAQYVFTDSSIYYDSDPVVRFYFPSNVSILFDATDLKIDYPLTSNRGGCGIYSYREISRNIPCKTVAGDFITTKDSYNVTISGINGGCYGAGSQKTYYARNLGEIYRVTSYANGDNQNRVHYTRELVSYSIKY